MAYVTEVNLISQIWVSVMMSMAGENDIRSVPGWDEYNEGT